MWRALNAGLLPPRPGFLERLRALTREHGTVLIFDEVITGFRVAYGGAQQLYGVQADMTTLGKIMGGGLPVGAYGGKAELMNRVAPAGPVYQAGTLSGNPAAVAAGIATLDVLRRPGVYEGLNALAQRLTAGLTDAAERAGVPLTVNRIGSVFTPFFCHGPVTDYASAKQSDTGAFGRFFRAMLDRGVYLPPSQFETGFVSTAHTERDVEDTVRAASESFAAIAN